MNKSRGDTLIEVLFGVTVFALISVTSMGIMNRSTAMAQRSLEIVQVRHQIDMQVDIIKLAHSDYISKKAQGQAVDGSGMLSKLWSDLKNNPNNINVEKTVRGTDGSKCEINGSTARVPFYASSSGISRVSSFRKPDTYSKVSGSESQGIGLYVNKVADSGSGSSSIGGVYDVYVYACWDGPDGNVASEKTIVRLYDF